ncbi:MAG: hypothetical protein JXB49_11375 [Bacteroidales bacterium]|nr:hypothetical protein [Bacteroidales bacterium]
MLLKIYRGNRPFVVVLVIITIIFFWIETFSNQTITSYVFDTVQMPLYALLCRIIPPQSIFSLYFTLVFLFLCAFMLVQLNIKMAIIDQRTYMPGFIFLYIASAYMPMQRFQPAIIGCIFFIFITKRIINTYKQEGISFNYFEASLLLSLSSLFYFNFTFFLPLIWLALMNFRPFKWREWVFTLLGFSIPYSIMFSYYYLLYGNIDKILLIIIKQIITVQAYPDLSDYEIANFVIIGLIFLLSSIYMIWTFPKKKIQLRKYYVYFLWMFLVTIGVFLISPFVAFEMITILAIPLSFLISHFYLETRSHYWGDILILFSLIMFGILEFSK